MTTTASTPLSLLRDLGSPEELGLLAEQDRARLPDLRVNSHVHLPPNFSAFDRIAQPVELAAEQGVDVLGVSNYYDYAAYAPFTAAAAARGVFPLFGLEIICMIDELREQGTKINDPGNPGKMYICGKGTTRFTDDTLTAEARRLLDKIRSSDGRRMAEMTGKLALTLAQRGLPTGLDHEGVKDMVAARHGLPRDTVHLQERHLCQAFQQRFFDKTPPTERLDRLATLLGSASKAKSPDDHVTIQNEVRAHLLKAGKSAFVDESFVTFDEAVRLILEMGGIPCYPVLADGASPICPFEATPEQLVRNLRDRGLYAAELIPIRNSPPVLRRYVAALREAGFIVTAGTEHNTLDLLPIEPTCIGGEPIPDDCRATFVEGACVVAAHQYLGAHGQAGYVDADGNPAGNYVSQGGRVAALARLGAAVIERFRAAAGRSSSPA